jgi:WD40 repeat protein
MIQTNTLVKAQKITSFKRSLAVVIGINEYQNKIPKLQTARRDAEVLAQILAEEHQYDEVILITDETECKPTLKNLLTLLEERLPKEIQPTKDDRLLFYFAGHGIARDSDKGPAGCLVPQDADLENNKTLLPMQKLHDCLNALPCRHLLVILDCCFAGTFRWSTARLATVIPTVIRKEHYDRFIKFPAWQAITSAAHNQEALDILRDNRGGINHSPFAEALFKALRGEGDVIPAAKNGKSAGDGVISATELYLYLRDHVETASNESQTPGIWTLSKHDRGEYIFLVPGAEPKLKPAPKLTEKNNPYRGLQSFEEEHSQLFFGRKELVHELYEKVSHASSSLTVVSGISGSGKSSLVKAGLIPYLKQNNSEKWYILKPMRPSESPFTALARTILLITNNNEIVVSKRLENLHFIEKIIQQEITDLKQRIDDGDINSEEDEIIRLEQKVNKFEKLANNWKRGTKEAKQRLIVDNFDELNNLCRNDDERTPLKEAVLDSLNPLSQRLQNPNEFIKIVKTWSQQRRGIRLLLVIDQFEELITLSSESKEDKQNKQSNLTESQQFLKLLLAILAANLPQLSIVVTLRSDFEPRFLNSEALKSHWTCARFPVRAMRSDELRQAIERPAAEMALYFEQLPEQRNSVDKLVDEVGQMPGALPLLSFTLSELYIKLAKKWETGEKSDRALTLDAEFEKEGGVAGSLTRRANKEYDSLPDDAHRDTMRRVMLRMVTIEGGQSARRRVPLSELVYVDEAENKRIEEVIDRLDKARLIISGQETGKPYVEPAHDFLVRSWDKLQKWQQEEQENLSLQRRLTPAAEEWKNIKDKEKQPNSLAKTWEQAESVAIGKIQTWRRNWQRRKQEETNISRGSNVKSIAYLWDDDPRLDQLNQVLNAENSWFNWIEDNFVRQSVLQKSKNSYRFWLIVTGVIVSLAGLSIFALIQLQYSVLREKAASVRNQLSTDPLKSIVSAIQATGQSAFPLGQVLSPVEYSLSAAVAESREQLMIRGHEGSVKSVALSPDGQTIVSSGEDGTIRLWDLTGKQINLIRGHEEKSYEGFNGSYVLKGVNSVVFSPNGQIIASGGDDGTVRLWNLQGQQLTRWRTVHQKSVNSVEKSVNSVAFSPNGDRVISLSEDSLWLWNLQINRVQNLLRVEPDFQYQYLKAVAFSPDGKYIVAVRNTEIMLWDINGNKLNFQQQGIPFDKGINIGFCSVVFGQDSKRIYTGECHGDGNLVMPSYQVRVWHIDEENKSLLQEEPEQNFISQQSQQFLSLAASADGIIASGSTDGTIHLSHSPAEVSPILRGHTDQINSIAFSLKEKQLVSASSDGTIRLWNLSDYFSSAEVDYGNADSWDNIYAVAFNPNGNEFAIAHKNFVKVFNREDNRLKHTFEHPLSEPNIVESVNSIAYSPDGKTIISASDDKTLRLWDLEGNKPHIIFQGHENSVTSVAFSPDSKMIVSGSQDNTVRLWNFQGNQLQVFRGHEESTGSFGNKGGVNSVAFSPDGKTIVSGADDKTLRLWDLEGNQLQVFQGHENSVTSVAFSPDSKMIVSGSFDKTLRFWDLKGRLIDPRVVQGHTEAIGSVGFSPDGKMIISAGADNMLKFWSLDGSPASVPFKNSEAIGRSLSAFAISPDSKTILSSMGGTNHASSSLRMIQNRNNWEKWLELACNRLHNHPVLLNPQTDIEKGARATCEANVWNRK